MAVAGDAELSWFAGIEDLIHVDRVDGVPLVHIGAPGPVRAGLVFRVGAADEALPQRGITHLIEHLALHGQATPADHSNGSTGTTLTQFVISGSEQQVVAFLNHVCSALRELPMERLDTERSILTVEAQGQVAPTDEPLQRKRYGALGIARAAYREFAAESATPEEILEWAHRWFVRGNVVAWMTTDHVPDGLDLRLPEGGSKPFSISPNSDLATPVWLEGPAGRVLVDAVVRRSTAAALFADVLGRSLFRQLRSERGVSYTATAQYEPLDADHARILVFADAQNDASAAVVGALVDALTALRDGSFDSADVEGALEHGRETERQAVASPEYWLGPAAFGFMLGGEPLHPDDISARREAVTTAELSAVAREFWNDAIWLASSAPDPASGVLAAPPTTDEPVEGVSFVHEVTRERVVLGDRGISVVSRGSTLTMPFEDCVLALQWGDGGRLMIRRDAAYLSIEPSAVRRFGAQELARLDAAVPPESVVRLPARSAETIPTAKVHPNREFGKLAIVAAVPLFVFGLLFVDGAVRRWLSVGELDRLGKTITAESVISGVVLALLGLGLAATLVWWGVRRIRWRGIY